MKLSYKQHLFFYFFILFSLFSFILIIVQQHYEKKERKENIQKTLADYIDLTQKYIELNQLNKTTIEQLKDFDLFLLDNVRITIINEAGGVLYDKDIEDYTKAEYHSDRPEIINSLSQPYGIDIRKSATTKEEYIYYAKHFDGYFIRVALPYNLEVKNLLEAGRYFIYITIILFIIVLILMNYVSERFEKSILQLKSFTTSIKNNVLLETVEFPQDELGEIGEEIKAIFKQKEEINQQIQIEREKLILHFQYSEKGICIFNPDFTRVYANSHFNYYLNLLLDINIVVEDNDIFENDIFSSVKDFILDDKRNINQSGYNITRNGKIYKIQALVFDDKSFEITINDITQTEQNRLLKQQMTSNIAHELKTPVTSIRAYLESLQEQKFPVEIQKQFIDRAFLQSERLAELIDDVSLIGKIEEAPSLFQLEEINISQLLSELIVDLGSKLSKNNIKVKIFVEKDKGIHANQSLIYSIFRNLMENSVKYAGENTEININNYLEDKEFLYFSYYDTGKGVAKEHLNRLFERFYRIEEGRVREVGGSGLGLSIVRNAVLFHKGKIEAKIHVKGGLQFLFTLKK